MNAGVVSMRYACALWDYASERHVEDEIYENMSQLMALLSDVRDFVVKLQNRAFDAKKRVSLLCQAIDNPTEEYRTFVSLVVKQEREDLLIYIAHAYISLYRKKKHIVAVKITTAVPLDKPSADKLVSLVKNDGYSEVELENVVDDSIIGGFMLEADSKRLDATLSGLLKKIEKQLVDDSARIV